MRSSDALVDESVAVLVPLAAKTVSGPAVVSPVPVDGRWQPLSAEQMAMGAAVRMHMDEPTVPV